MTAPTLEYIAGVRYRLTDRHTNDHLSQSSDGVEPTWGLV